MFTIGMIVYLLSGSPAMTVGSLSKDGVYVDWFSGGTHYSATFPAAALTVTDPVPTLDVARQTAIDSQLAKRPGSP